jgi:hypothetical protein
MVVSFAKPPDMVGDCLQMTLKGEVMDFSLRFPRHLVKPLRFVHPPVEDSRPISGTLD